jgi:hypothetical protein
MNQFLQRLIDKAKPVVGLAPITPSSSTPDYVSLKNHSKLTVILIVDNGSTVTGSAITLKQATAVDGTDEKALAFSKMHANTDVAAGDTLTETSVTSNTFTTDTTNGKNLLYVIEVDATDLDIDDGFDCVRVGTGDGANMVLAALYILHGSRFGPGNDVVAIED